MATSHRWGGGESKRRKKFYEGRELGVGEEEIRKDRAAAMNKRLWDKHKDRYGSVLFFSVIC